MKNKKNKLIFLIIICSIIACIGCIYLIKKHDTNNNITVAQKDEKNESDVQIFEQDKKDELQELINVSDCSEEFMQDYINKVRELNQNDYQENILIVIAKQKIENSYGASKIIEAPNNQYILQYESTREKEDALNKFKSDSSVVSAEENTTFKLDNSNYNSWGIEAMSLDYAIDSSNINLLSDVTVAIIDSGCDIELFNKYYSGKISGSYSVIGSSQMNDAEGHGTHIAGTIAEGTTSNVKIFPVQVTTSSSINTYNIVTAINYIVFNNKADVINMSFGATEYNSAVNQAIEAANRKNIICVASAGNDNSSENCYPASLDNTISISSVNSQLKKSSFSNYGSTITFSAPGSSIKSIMGKDANISKMNGNTDNDDDHETISGTSMATPHAVCAVALLRSYNNNLTLSEIIEILKENAIDLGMEGWDQYYGYGFISFKDVLFRDEEEPYEGYGVYKDTNKTVTNIEITELNITGYNYYSITNLLGSKIKIYNADGTSSEMYLWEVPSLEIVGYNPLDTNEQEVTIKYAGETISINVINPSSYESGWEYTTTADNKICLTGYKSHGLNIGKLFVPETINSKNVVSFENNLRFIEKGNDFLRYKKLYLPSEFRIIGDYTLSNTKIEHIYGESDGIEIGSHALESTPIQTVEASITAVSESAFKNATNLDYLDLSKDLKEIGDYAFYNCSSLKTLNLQLIEAKIGKYAFFNSGITILQIGSVEDEIGESAFENCKNLTSIYIDTCNSSIESRAFWNSGVQYIQIGGNITKIAEDAFAYSPVRDGNIDEGRYYSESGVGICDRNTNKLVVGFTYGANLIPNGITEIGNYAYTGNLTLQKITIPLNVVRIGAYAFKDCQRLAKIELYSNIIEFGDNSIDKTYIENGKYRDLTIYVHKDSQAKQFVANKNYKYKHFEPDELIVIDDKLLYEPGDTVNSEGIIVKLIYHEKVDREETLSPMNDIYGFYISYQNQGASKINVNDTYYVVHAKNEFGYELTKNVEIELIDTGIKTASITYRTHIQDYGWQGYKKDGAMSGTSGESKRLEGINIKLIDSGYDGGVEYRTHVQNIGWQGYVSNGAMSGTQGMSYRLEAIQIRLKGEISEYYDIYYRVHCQNIGWMNWAKNDEKAGTAGYSYRLEGIEIVLVEKGEEPPVRNNKNYSKGYKSTLVTYRTHVQDYGWQDYVVDGEMAGTSGESKRLEGINIKLANPEYSGGIKYRTHVQNIGWQDYVTNGRMAGTQGMSYRLEAIQIRLTGTISEYYDVYYRVHCQNIGWMDWAKNDEKAGTAGYSYRLEAIEIRLIEKGKGAPGKTVNHYKEI